ncbi:MAG: hypothetical protein P3W96_001990 [Halomonas sp.]|nr:hypothetical protein [Halomonas sp.]MDM7480775.1 hypothetical protein [Halomonas sp.]
MTDLTSTQAFWLGHLFHASSRQLPLSEYAEDGHHLSRIGGAIGSCTAWGSQVGCKLKQLPAFHKPHSPPHHPES